MVATRAREFVTLGKEAGLALKFQMGEPWWWIAIGYRVCGYDAATSDWFTSALSNEDLDPLVPGGGGMIESEEGVQWRLEGNGGALVEWSERNENEMTRVAVPNGLMAVRPLSPVHGHVHRHSDGSLTLNWVRRSRVHMGWRDEVDVPLGESRERWRIRVVPDVPNVGPWESERTEWSISSADLALIPSGAFIEINQIGDFSVSLPLKISLP